MEDGRLGRELALLRDNARFRVLLVEGRMHFDYNDNLLLNGRRTSCTKNAINSLFRSCRYVFGVDKEESNDIEDTVSVVRELTSWLNEAKHDSLFRRPKVQGDWGKPSKGEVMTWWYQGIPGIGPRTARKLTEKYESPREFVLTTAEELQEIDGIGKITAGRIVNFMEGV